MTNTESSSLLNGNQYPRIKKKYSRYISVVIVLLLGSAVSFGYLLHKQSNLDTDPQ